MIGLIDLPATTRLILASGSPRRRDLLREAGLSFEIMSPEVEELKAGDLPPRELALTNARLKSLAIAKDHPNDIVLGSDTVVALGGKVYGKPVDLSEASENLRTFSGRVHEVISAVSIIGGDKGSDFIETSYVKFRSLDEVVIQDYLAKVHVLDKAGGYAIQDQGEMLVEKVEGDFDNIVGLPVGKVLDHLKEIGFPLPR